MNQRKAAGIVHAALKLTGRAKSEVTRGNSTLAELGILSTTQVDELKLRIALYMNSESTQGFSQPAFLGLLKFNIGTTFREATALAVEAFELSVGPQDYHCTGPKEHGFSAAAARSLSYRCPMDASRIVSD